MVAYAINDTILQNYCKAALEMQIQKNLNIDGTSFDFIERDALHYHVYTLEPLLKVSIIIKRVENLNYYNFNLNNGASISKSVNFLIPYLTGEKTHAEFVNSKIKFDRMRANNNEPNFITGAFFNPQHGLKVLALASYFDSDLYKTITKVPKSSYLVSILDIPTF